MKYAPTGVVLGDLLLGVVNELALYQEYAERFGSQLDEICCAMSAHPRQLVWQAICERAGRDARSRHRDFKSLLSLPLRRLNEYTRLIDEVLRWLPTGHCDGMALQEAEEGMAEVE